jgi:DNA-binding protein H-NS
MRRPRDYDAELKALDDKARQLRQRKVMQLGELVMACKADALPPEELAGALLAAAATTDFVTKEEWRKAGEALFASGRSSRRAGAKRAGIAADDRNASSGAGQAGAS